MINELTNHLWQSTLFALAAGLLTLAFRNNRAHVRYGLWLSASLKFFIPFSLLIGLGSYFAPTAKTVATQAVSITVVQIAQPFSENLSFPPATPRSTDWFPIAIFGVWLCGFGVIALMRMRDWLRIRAAVRASTRLKIPAAVEVRSYPGLLEPGVVGLLRPVLLLPEGIVDRLTPPQLEAVFAHELCHVRRRDNLTATIHMVVETIFWFHPFVWWIGSRLVEERERVCDEEVLRLGGEPGVYAEAILNVCKFYVESPLACMSGVTGSDLKKRIERIMKEHFSAALSVRKKLLLVAAGVVALAVPIVVGALAAPRLVAQAAADRGGRPEFDVASVKPNKSVNNNMRFGGLQAGGRFLATNVPLAVLINAAYQLKPHQLIGGPKWVGSERFDIEAKMSADTTREEAWLMLQSLLADRFKLIVHHEMRPLPLYALVLSKAGRTGPHLARHSDDAGCSDGTGNSLPKSGNGGASPDFCQGFRVSRGSGTWVETGKKISMDAFVMFLGGFVDRLVVNQTGLSGDFDMRLEFTSDERPLDFLAPSPDLGPSETQGPSVFTALQEQLGLRLVPQTGPIVDVLVIDHVEEPSDNSGQAPAQQPEAAQAQTAAGGKVAFEVASIKPNRSGGVRQMFQFPPDSDRFTATNLAVRDLIQFAFYLQDYQLSKGPSWMNSNRYDIAATIPEQVKVNLRTLSRFQQMEQVQLMLQALLAERFKLKVSHETQKLPVYALVAAKDGPKLTPNTQPDPLTSGPKEPSLHLTGRGQITGNGVLVSLLADVLSKQLGRKVLDKTGLSGNYDFKLQWTPDEAQAFSSPDGSAIRANTPPPDSSGPSIFTALQEQLGLRLESQTGPVDFLVVDHLEEPSPN